MKEELNRQYVVFFNPEYIYTAGFKSLDTCTKL